MGNANTEKKKAKNRKVRAKEVQKTRLYRHNGWDNLTSFTAEETLLACKLPKKPLTLDKRCLVYLRRPSDMTGTFGQCLGCGRSVNMLKAIGHARL